MASTASEKKKPDIVDADNDDDVWGDGGAGGDDGGWGDLVEADETDIFASSKKEEEKKLSPEEISKERVAWLKQAAPAIIQLKQNPKLDEKKREHAATLIESLYLDFTQREKGDFKPVDREKVKQENAKIKSCTVCYCAFDGKGTKAQKMYNCGHETVCTDCFAQMIVLKVKDKALLPWLFCAEPECKIPIAAADIASALSALEMYSFVDTYLHKHLARDNLFVPCKNEDCRFGFYLKDIKEVRDDKCAVCFKSQQVKFNEVLDDEFQKMIKDGTMKKCPGKCQTLHMKEKGICAVINCAKCGIWFNWITMETARDSASLKAKARATGTLWLPGELEYQQRLQQENPEEFRKLLERNGIKYEANYVRGS